MCCFRKFLFLCARDHWTPCWFCKWLLSPVCMHLSYTLYIHVYNAICTNLNGNFKWVYMCLIWLLEPEEKKLQQNPEGLNCQNVRMDVKKPKPWALWKRFPAGVYQESCLSAAGLCPGQTLLPWHVDITSQWSALSFHSFSWKIPAETT